MDEQLLKLVSEGEGGSARDIRMLFENGARVDMTDHAGWSLLHWACRGKSPDCVQIARILLSEGAAVNAPNHRGETPLHIAAAHGCIKIGYVLLDHGARIHAKDNNGNTPLDIANPPEQVATAFIARKKELDKLSSRNTQLITVVGSRNRKTFEKLLQIEHEQLVEHVNHEKMAILATQETSMESVQSTIESLQQRMNHLEQQLQQYQQHNNHNNKNVDDDYADDDDKNNECNKPRASSQYDHQPGSGEQEPPMKRRKHHELILQSTTNETEGGVVPTRISRIGVVRVQNVSTSFSCTVGSRLNKVKMEEEEEGEVAIGDNNNDTNGGDISSTTANCEHDHRDILIAALEQKVEHLQGELEASQETANHYKMELDEYKKKMNQLRQLTG